MLKRSYSTPVSPTRAHPPSPILSFPLYPGSSAKGNGGSLFSCAVPKERALLTSGGFSWNGECAGDSISAAMLRGVSGNSVLIDHGRAARVSSSDGPGVDGGGGCCTAPSMSGFSVAFLASRCRRRRRMRKKRPAIRRTTAEPTPTPTPIPIRADRSRPAPWPDSPSAAGLVSVGVETEDAVSVSTSDEDGMNDVDVVELVGAAEVSSSLLSSTSLGGLVGTCPGIQMTDSPRELPSRTRSSRTDEAVNATVRGSSGHQQGSGEARVSGDLDCTQANHSSDVPLQ